MTRKVNVKVEVSDEDIKNAITLRKDGNKKKNSKNHEKASKSFRNTCCALFKEPSPNMDKIKYICWQKEVCPTTGKEHWQTYCEFKDKYSIGKCKEYLGVENAHIEKRMGEPSAARAYCCKQESRAPGSEFFEYGVIPNDSGKGKGGKGKRNDLVRLANKVVNKEEIEPVEILRYDRGIQALRAHLNQKETAHFRHVKTTVLYGKAGKGKTSFIFEKHGYENVYKLDACNGADVWFDGYDGQTVLLIDDFYGWIKWGQLLNILDGYPLRLQIKNSHGWANWDTVYITSNSPITSWYESTDKRDFTALTRRIFAIVNYEDSKNKIKVREPIQYKNISEWVASNDEEWEKDKKKALENYEINKEKFNKSVQDYIIYNKELKEYNEEIKKNNEIEYNLWINELKEREKELDLKKIKKNKKEVKVDNNVDEILLQFD